MSWSQILKHEAEQSYFKLIINAVQEDAKTKEVYPPHDKIFEAFKLTPFNKVKVVIIGQDPYHNPGQAHGLAFSVQPGVTIPPSLQNIYKELKADLEIEIPSHGCLTGWAKEGVLLLNTSLTVRKNEPGSHKDIGWAHFTSEIMSHLDSIDSPIVFILWGAHAKGQRKYLAEKPNQLILEAAHPSPFSAYNGFFGTKPFSKTNKFLEDKGIGPINWANFEI